nr:hypothetical protein [Tanacetum cinerariifolium]
MTVIHVKRRGMETMSILTLFTRGMGGNGRERQMTADAIDKLNSFHEVLLALIHFDQDNRIKMIHVKEMMQDKDLINSKSNDKGSRSRSQSMNDQSHYKQAKTKINEKTRQPPTRMFSVVKECQYKRSSLQQQRNVMKETSTLGEIVSLNFIQMTADAIDKLNSFHEVLLALIHYNLHVTPPDGAWTEYVSGGVTLLRISSTKHKERPLRVHCLTPRVPRMKCARALLSTQTGKFTPNRSIHSIRAYSTGTFGQEINGS